MTRLIEFKNKNNDLLRGILSLDNPSNNKGVIFLHGFERTATTEKKFKKLSDELARKHITSFRFDYTGCGLSDGDFRYTTVQKMTDDLQEALKTFKHKSNIEEIITVAHSLSSCTISKYLNKKENKDKFSKIVLIAPALNQKELLRYWFVKSSIEKKENLEITWGNYREYLDEKEFRKDCNKKDKITKSNHISNRYFIENINKDYSKDLLNIKNILHIHGNKDDKVPLEGIKIKFSNSIIVKNGDHDLERPDMMKQWFSKCISFIVS